MSQYGIFSGYGWLMKEITRRWGRERMLRIRRRAEEELTALRQACRNLSAGEKQHVHGTILPRAAVYRAMLEEIPADALPLTEEAVRRAGERMSSLLRGLTAVPGMRRVYLRIFTLMAKKMFGPPAGFRQVMHRADRNEVRFDITACPYCRWCELLGCRELIGTFCQSDEYCFGRLSGIRFQRTQTLGSGGDRCDFHLTIEKQRTE